MSSNFVCDVPLLTLPSEQRDFVEWRQGRKYFSLWAIDLDLPLLRTASGEIRRAMGDCCLPGYQRQPHLTVNLCGFPAATAKGVDDYPLAHFMAACDALKCAAAAPFSIEIGGPDSFTSAAYFSVRDLDGGIEKLRHILGAGDANYVPHVTFALYRAALPLPAVVADLRARNPLPDSRLQITRLAWMVYEAAVVGGPLTTVGEFDLQTNRFAVREPDLWTTVFD